MKKIKVKVKFIFSAFITFFALLLPCRGREYLNWVLFFLLKPVKDILAKRNVLPKGIFDYFRF